MWLRLLAQTPSDSSVLSPWVRWARVAYRILAWLLVTCVGVQIFLAGWGIWNHSNWGPHSSFVHVFEGLPLLMLIAAFLGKLPVRLRWLTLLPIVQISLQYALAHIPNPMVNAFHPVNGMLLSWLALYLARARH